MVGPGRLVVLPEAEEPDGDATAGRTGSASLVLRADPDGTLRRVVKGFRLVEAADGSIQCSSRSLPSHAVDALDMPGRLGGGYLFWAEVAEGTALYRSKTWTGTLEPLAQVDFALHSVVAGFDRLYLRARDTSEWVALDPLTGKVMDLGSLPPAPGYHLLAFGDEWFGLAVPAFQGPLVTYDAGTSWSPLAMSIPYTAQGITQGPEAGSILLIGSDGTHLIDAEGHQTAVPASGVLGRPLGRSDAPGASAQGHPLGKYPLRFAVLHGWPDSPSTAVVAGSGRLARVRLDDGAVLASQAQAYLEPGDCHGIRLGRGFGFVCGQEQTETSVYEYREPLNLVRVAHFAGPRQVSPSGNGGLIIRGSCRQEGSATDPRDLYCVRTPQGGLEEIRVKGDVGVERLVALEDGRIAVIVPPRMGSGGRLYVINRDQSLHPIRLRLPKQPAVLHRLLQQGLWLDGFQEESQGALAGWVAGAGQFVGVRIQPNGDVEAGPVSDDLERTSFSGPRGLSLMQPGLAKETSDHGFTWSEVVLPSHWDVLGPRKSVQGFRGCSEVGCGLGSWLRVGWGKGPKSRSLLEADLPPGAVFPSSGGGRWSLHCSATGESLSPPPAAASAKASPGTRGLAARRAAMASSSQPTLARELIESSAFPSFQGMPAPLLRAGDVALDHRVDAADAQFHVYAWGPRLTEWVSRDAATGGRWVIRGSDPFRLKSPVWSTAITKSPWSDSLAAALAFGHNPYGSPSPNFTITGDPDGRGGLLFINSANSVPEVFLFEEGRPIVKLEDGAALGSAGASGVVEVGGARYFGVDGELFRVFVVEGNRARLLGEYPKLVEGSAQSLLHVSVVRSARKDALGLWVRATKFRGSHSSWFVYPIDLSSGALAPPFQLTPKLLGALPPACNGDSDGWLLEGSPPVSPYLDLIPSQANQRPRELRARLLATPSGLCVNALAAEGDSPLNVSASRVTPKEAGHGLPVELSLSEEGNTGRRMGYQCTP